MSPSQPASRVFSFIAGTEGPWHVDHVKCVVGEPIPFAPRLAVVAGAVAQEAVKAAWILRGAVSNERYVTREEKTSLVAKQEGLGRPRSTRAALIPVRKTEAWWQLTQDERRDIFEERSRHIAVGLKYLPAVARRLHHCRDLASEEPFDFLTWFEYAPADAPAFEELVQVLRATAEWTYVDREVDIRLIREGA